MSYISHYREEIDGYAYGDSQGGYADYIELSIKRFDENEYLPDDVHPLLAILYLLFRRDYWTGGYAPPVEEMYADLIKAVLTKASYLARQIL